MSQESDAIEGQPAADGLAVAKITGCYGIKGWLKVQSYTESQEDFLDYGHWQLQRRGHLEPIEIDQAKPHGKGLVIHIKGVDDRTSAEAFTGLEVVVPAGELPVLAEGEYYWRDLQGLQVWCRDDTRNRDDSREENGAGNDGEKVLLGTVSYLLETGANDVLVVKACAGSIDERERLIPYLPGQTISRVDLAEAVIDVVWFIDEE